MIGGDQHDDGAAADGSLATSTAPEHCRLFRTGRSLWATCCDAFRYTNGTESGRGELDDCSLSG